MIFALLWGHIATKRKVSALYYLYVLQISHAIFRTHYNMDHNQTKFFIYLFRSELVRI